MRRQRSRSISPAVILLLMAVALAGCGVAGAGPAAGGTAEGVRFQEITREAGVQFVHKVATFDAKVQNIMPWLNSVGASAAVADYDGNGCLDFYVTNSGEGSQNALFRSNCDGTFRDVAASVGLADVNQEGVSVSATWADYTNSGCPSLYILRWGKSDLYQNHCDGTFTRVTDKAGVGYSGYPVKAAWLDYNRDGCLDLYVGVYFRPDQDLWHLTTTRIMHDDFERAHNGGRNLLYKNNCDGTFVDVAADLGVDDPGWTLATGSIDVNGDGWPDIYNANDFGPDTLYLNDAGKGFRKVVRRGGIGDDTHKGMNVDFGDLKNDGAMAIYVSNISKPRYILEGNTVWLQQPGGEWKNVAADLGVDNCGFSWGAKFLDADNDSRLDIFVMSGFVNASKKKDYWYELGTLATTPGQVVEDAANWPPIGDKSLSGYEPNCLFLARPDGTYKDVAVPAGITSTHAGRGAAVADLFNRGRLDVILANQNAPVQVYRNETDNGNHWLTLNLVGRAPSNRDAIGARVRVVAGGTAQVQYRSSDPSHGAQGDPRLHFGLGQSTQADRIEIVWPSGREQVLTNVGADQFLTIQEADTPAPSLR